MEFPKAYCFDFGNEECVLPILATTLVYSPYILIFIVVVSILIYLSKITDRKFVKDMEDAE